MIHKKTIEDLRKEVKRFKRLFKISIFELIKANNKIAKLEEELRQWTKQ